MTAHLVWGEMHKKYTRSQALPVMESSSLEQTEVSRTRAGMKEQPGDHVLKGFQSGDAQD